METPVTVHATHLWPPCYNALSLDKYLYDMYWQVEAIDNQVLIPQIW